MQFSDCAIKKTKEKTKDFRTYFAAVTKFKQVNEFKLDEERMDENKMV